MGYCIYRYNCIRIEPISTIFLKYVFNKIDSGSILVGSVGFANYLNCESDRLPHRSCYCFLSFVNINLPIFFTLGLMGISLTLYFRYSQTAFQIAGPELLSFDSVSPWSQCLSEHYPSCVYPSAFGLRDISRKINCALHFSYLPCIPCQSGMSHASEASQEQHKHTSIWGEICGCVSVGTTVALLYLTSIQSIPSLCRMDLYFLLKRSIRKGLLNLFKYFHKKRGTQQKKKWPFLRTLSSKDNSEKSK